jgi:hypothetical protein
VKTTFKWLVICINAIWFLTLPSMIVFGGGKISSPLEALSLAAILTVPLLSIAALLFIGRNSNSWLSLYIQRRKLEEQFKIERLLSHSDFCRDFYSDEIHHKS